MKTGIIPAEEIKHWPLYTHELSMKKLIKVAKGGKLKYELEQEFYSAWLKIMQDSLIKELIKEEK